VIRVERDVLTRSASTGLWQRSTETALYLATTAISAVRAAAAIRDHWTVENTSHYSRDVTMGEDRSRIRCNPSLFARLRSFAFNILKANRRSSLPQDRFRAAIGGVDYLLRGGFHNYLRLICPDQRSLAAAAHIGAGRQGQPDWISDFCTSSPRSSMPVIGHQIAALATRRPRRSAW
jgi:hypothetical protein